MPKKSKEDMTGRTIRLPRRQWDGLEKIAGYLRWKHGLDLTSVGLIRLLIEGILTKQLIPSVLNPADIEDALAEFPEKGHPENPTD